MGPGLSHRGSGSSDVPIPQAQDPPKDKLNVCREGGADRQAGRQVAKGEGLAAALAAAGTGQACSSSPPGAAGRAGEESSFLTQPPPGSAVPTTPTLCPPGKPCGYFLGAGSPVSLLCITESTPIYLPWANKAAVSGGTLTIFNDSGWGPAGWGGPARKGSREQAQNCGGNSACGGGGEIKGGCKAILTG